VTDYHVHLEHGPLAVSWIRQFVDAARKAGVDDLGFSDHDDRFREFRGAMAPLLAGSAAPPDTSEWLETHFADSVSSYVRSVEDARATLGVGIKLGIEADYVPGAQRELAAALAGQLWDYVLGSVHFIDGWAFDYAPDKGWSGRDVDSVYHAYFDNVLELVATGLFDILTHPDVVKVFGHRPTVSMQSRYAEVARALAGAGMSAEVSTAGLRTPVGEMYPGPDFLRALAAEGVPLVLSSDAHYPEHVGHAFPEATEYIASFGYTKTAAYSERRRVLVDLPRAAAG
jgi:histidinol-phosphatase (PHP family)